MSEIEQLVVPQAPEAEEAVLGALLLSGQHGSDAAASVAERVRDSGLEPGDFYKPSHGQLYKTALMLHEQGRPVDPITMAAALERQGLLDQVGGGARIAELSALATSTANAGHHARLVRESAIRRRVLTLATGRVCPIFCVGVV